MPTTSASASLDNEEVPSPVRAAAVSAKERHKQVFNEKAFGIDVDGQPLPASELTKKKNANSKIKSVDKYNEILYAVSNWKTKEQQQTLTDDEKKALRALKKKNKNIYDWVKEYKVESGAFPDGTPKQTLIRIEADRPDAQRTVLPHTKIFDAIDEIHEAGGHMGQERTYTECSKKYYNVTQELVKIYCESCRSCLEKQPAISAHKGAKSPIVSAQFRDRFEVDLIDLRKKQKRDIYGVMQRWIVTVKDHGAVKVVTENGVLTHSSSKNEYWIPSDKYSLKYNSTESANISSSLETIRVAVVKGDFNLDAYEKISIPRAHQLTVGASSPCIKSGCSCKNGNCKGSCGCIRGTKGGKPRACSSRCSCSGSCSANPLNDCN